MKNRGKYKILGCGAMGCAMGHILSAGGNEVEMIALVYDEHVLKNCMGENVAEKKDHEVFGVKLDEGLSWQQEEFLSVDDMAGCDVIVAVNSKGLAWSQDWLEKWDGILKGVIFATKGVQVGGLESANQRNLGLLTGMRDMEGAALPLGVFAGPVLAAEFVRGLPTSLMIASEDKDLLDRTKEAFSGQRHIDIEMSNDVVGVAWCAALKNLYAIGVSAVEGMFGKDAQNVQASMFVKGLQEMTVILSALGVEKETVWSIAGVGDLYVTSGGGRNGKFGRLLGQGLKSKEIENGEMKGVTIEGLHFAYAVEPLLNEMVARGMIEWDMLPLTRSLFDSLIGGKVLSFRHWFH